MTVVDPHLDDMALSAAADGEADPGAAAHLAGCERCRGQLDAWRCTLADLGTTDERAPGLAADAPVAAALAAWDRMTPAGLAAGGRRRGVAASAGARRRKLALAAVGVAAAAALAVAVGQVAPGASSSSTASSAASGSPAALAPQASPAAPGASAGPGGSAASALPSGPTAEGGGSAASPGKAGGSAALPDLGAVAGPTQLASALRPLLAHPSAGANDPCLHAAQRRAGATASPLAAAAVSWKGTAGWVLAFPAAGGGDVAEVIATDCHVLSSVPIPAP